MNNAKISFEEGMERLEGIVRALESADTGLEDSFARYEEGMKLYAQLKTILDDGDKRIRALTKQGERVLSDGEDEE